MLYLKSRGKGTIVPVLFLPPGAKAIEEVTKPIIVWTRLCDKGSANREKRCSISPRASRDGLNAHYIVSFIRIMRIA